MHESWRFKSQIAGIKFNWSHSVALDEFQKIEKNFLIVPLHHHMPTSVYVLCSRFKIYLHHERSVFPFCLLFLKIKTPDGNMCIVKQKLIIFPSFWNVHQSKPSVTSSTLQTSIKFRSFLCTSGLRINIKNKLKANIQAL